MTETGTAQHGIEDLESMVDRFTLQSILEWLDTICIVKAEHLRANWQDETTAKVWERAASAIAKVAVNSAVNDLS